MTASIFPDTSHQELERLASDLVDSAAQSAFAHLSAFSNNSSLDPRQRLAQEFPTLTLTDETDMETATLKSCVHRKSFSDGRKRSVTFDPKFVKDNLEGGPHMDNHKDPEEAPRQRKVSHVPSVATQPEEYSGDEEVTRL